MCEILVVAASLRSTCINPQACGRFAVILVVARKLAEILAVARKLASSLRRF